MRNILRLVLWLLMLIITVSARKGFKKTSGLRSQCLGNIMKITVDKSLAIGNRLEVDAINDGQFIPISNEVASRCGYSIQADPWGNTNLFASVLNCDAQSQDDEAFRLGIRLSMYEDHRAEADVHDLKLNCKYNQWADREVLCERNYMEVSVNRLLSAQDQVVQDPKTDEQQTTAMQDVTSEKNIWKVVFFTPREKTMLLADAQKAGYGIATTATRLVVRSSYSAKEMSSENIGGVMMKVLKATTYFKDAWSVTMLDTAAACPTDGVSFTGGVITWYVPRCITPLLLSSSCETLEVHMGIQGERLSKTEVASRGYTLSVTDTHVLLQMPVGGPDGYFKSCAPQHEYHTSYSIEPMIEMLWKEADLDQVTRYKVLNPIRTPLTRHTLHVIDHTEPEEKIFKVFLGTFLHDVVLVNLTLATGVLTVSEANDRGFNVQEHRYPNGSKAFSLQVPFSDPVVLKNNPDVESTTYTLPIIFGLAILPEHTPFAHPAVLEALLQDVVLPVITGTCDHEYYHVTLAYGSQGKDIKTIVGERELTNDKATEYDFGQNATHCTMRIPFLSPDTVFTYVISTGVGGRLDLKVIDSVNNWSLLDFSLACTFPMHLTECGNNGTVTVLALKVESAPHVIPSQLTLKDPSCKPALSDDRFATFSFPVNTCGTTRTVTDGYMIYQNEITIPGGSFNKKASKQPYRLTVVCYYGNEELKTLPFVPEEQDHEYAPKIGYGEMLIRMRLATDGSYDSFYTEDDYPVKQLLRHPLHFEVELESTDPELDLFLDSCWATLDEDSMSTPRWDLIIDGCPNEDDRQSTILHPVDSDRVQFPTHLKRFEMKMFAFVQKDEVVDEQIFVHCDAAVCDRNKQSDGLCYRRCSSYPEKAHLKSRSKGGSGPKISPRSRTQLTSGGISLSRH